MKTSTPVRVGNRSRRRAGTVLRTGLGTVLALAAASLVSVLVPLHWVDDTVLSREGFTRVVGTLADDRPFQEELARTAVDRAADVVLGERTGLPFLDRILEDAARRAGDLAAGLTADPAYQRAWTQTLVRTHEANVPAPGETPPANLVVDLRPLLDELDGAVERAVGFDIGLSERQGVVTVPGTGTGRLIETWIRLTDLAVPLTWAAAALAGLALVVTRHRFATLAVLGLGSLVGLGVVGELVERGVRRVTGLLGPDPVVRLVVDRVTDLLLGSLGEQMLTAAWVAGATGVVGVLGAVVAAVVSAGSRRRHRPTA
ncbi:hypothetical protein ACH9EU_05060 [Kocuria sp. M1R5S2]|uniref:hypothetical protein n=1 Tax=Kocuria rhizosphaerae TaxID=3376285 RepID=UPI0037B60ACB